MASNSISLNQGHNIFDIEQIKEKLGIVILAYSDYETLEITLAVHCKSFPHLTKNNKRIITYVLCNGCGSYDCDRTLMVAKRYENLFPKDIKVIDEFKDKNAYTAIRSLLESKYFNDIEYVIKYDDDVFPLTSTWLNDLCLTYVQQRKKYEERLAYVSGLVNNNPLGFKLTLNAMNLTNEYFNKYARDHVVGMETNPVNYPIEIINKEQISTNGGGTIWRYPYIARFIHEKTTLKPDDFINATNNLGPYEVNNKERYSINCMLFKKSLWKDISNGANEDEFMLHTYCRDNDKVIVVAQNIPLVHLFFHVQYFENKDLLPVIRNIYTNWLKLPFKISICDNIELENENRLKYIENQMRKIEKNMLYNRYRNKKRKLKLAITRLFRKEN